MSLKNDPPAKSTRSKKVTETQENILNAPSQSTPQNPPLNPPNASVPRSNHSTISEEEEEKFQDLKPKHQFQDIFQEPIENNMTRIKTETLISLLTNFNGDRNEAQNFLINAQNALNLAEPDQTYPLTIAIFSKISADVKSKINISRIHNFTDLKRKIQQRYCKVESTSFLLETLDTMKQNPNESIIDFYSRLDKQTTKCLSAIQRECLNELEAPGQLSFIENTALRRFKYHTRPEISQILRHKDGIRDINQALSIALEEERILELQRTIYRTNIRENSNRSTKFCHNCKVSTHATRDCRNRSNPRQHNYRSFNHEPSSSNHPNSYQSNNYQQNNYPRKQCSYCKNLGHTIDECKKKMYNEQRRSSSFTNPKVASLNSNQSTFTQAQMLDSNVEASTSVQIQMD